MKIAISAVLAAVLAGALGFYGGVTYQKTQTQSAFAGRFQDSGGPRVPGQGGAGNGQRGVGRQAGSVATGTILAKDSTSITVKTGDGGSKKVFLSANTRYSQQQELTAADLKVGDLVMAVGQPASGGIDARSITVVPPGSDFRGFGGGGGGFGGPPPAGN